MSRIEHNEAALKETEGMGSGTVVLEELKEALCTDIYLWFSFFFFFYFETGFLCVALAVQELTL